MKKIALLIITAVFVCFPTYSQENPYRIGLTVGTPNLVGLNLEYVTPALNAKLAPSFDFSVIKIETDDINYRFTYAELGGNYYFGKKSKGLYGHASLGRIGFKGDYSDPLYGSGEGKLGINLISFKVGAKWGNRFYFRPEIGFANFIGDTKVRVEYNDPITNLTIIVEEEIPNSLKDGMVFNLSVGVAF
mgnify:CR=1 FL=1